MKTTRTLLVSMVFLTLVGCTGEAPGTGPTDPTMPVDPVEEPKLTPAVLSLSVSASPMMISVGQDILLEVTVHNSGESTASSVVPMTPKQTGSGLAVITTAPNPLDIAGGQTQRFTFVYTATDSGSLTFEVGAAGIDQTHDRDVIADPQSVTVMVQSAAMLSVESLVVPSTVVVGSDFTVTMTVANVGQSPAKNVSPEPLTLSAPGTATLVSGPTPTTADLEKGASTAFTWTYRAETRGVVSFTGGARGLDGNSQTPVVAEALESMPVAVETPAALEVTMSIPSNLSRGQTFTATLVVRNTGGATATGVLPNPLLPASMSVSGNAAASTTTAPAPADIPGGGTVTFTWTYVASGTGSLSIAAGARGTDAATGMVLDAPMASSDSATVMAPSTLAITSLTVPSPIARGQTFDVTMVVRNNGTAAVTGVLPNPNPATLVATGGAGARTTTTLTAQTIAAGASATFTWSYTETGTSAGSLSFTAGARGMNGTTAVTANPTSSNLALVVVPPSLRIDSVTVPARVSRSQSFDAVVVVRNAGGSSMSGVIPTLTVATTGGADATPAAAAPLTISAGMTATFTFPLVENGTGPGTLQLSAAASGTDAASGQAITSAAVTSRSTTVETAAALTITAFSVPASVARGAGFALSMTVRNSGQAAARNVIAIPSPPTATVTGGVVVSTASTVTPVTIAGNSTQTFTWLYTETGTGPGTVSFTGGVQGLDFNSGRAVTVPAQSSNSSSVAVATGCNGSALYGGFGGRSLDGDRLDQAVGKNRLRVKPYPMLVTEYNRVLGSTPAFIQNKGQTFSQPGARWDVEQELSAVSLYQAFQGSFQGCLTFTSTGTQFAANPTAATANTQCAALQRRFWSRVPTAAETAACVTFATSAVNNDANPRRRWAYTCAAVLTSTGFLAQ